MYYLYSSTNGLVLVIRNVVPCSPSCKKKLEQIGDCQILAKSGIISKELSTHNAEKIISILDVTLPELLFFVENALDYHLLENFSVDCKEKDTEARWNLIEEHRVIPIQKPLYLTVLSKKDSRRIL